MELSAELDRERNMLVIHVTGTYRRPNDSFEAQRFIVDSYPEYGCRRVLLDLTRANVIAGTLDTLETAESRPEIAQDLRKFSFAALYSKITEDERFYEDAAVNRAFRVRIFDERDKAIAWLEQE